MCLEETDLVTDLVISEITSKTEVLQMPLCGRQSSYLSPLLDSPVSNMYFNDKKSPAASILEQSRDELGPHFGS